MTTLLVQVADHLVNSAIVVDPVLGAGLTTRHIRTGPPVPASEDQAATNAVPAAAVFLIPTGGLTVRQGRDDDTEEPATVQVMIRSAPYDFDAGHAFSLAVYGALIGGIPGCFHAEVFSGPPAWLHQDAQGQHLFVVNVLLKRVLSSPS